jgi:signal transduction histidine kinase
MTWILGPDISAALLEHWEATINTIFVPGFPGRIACQYNQSRLSPEVMLAALHTHPLAILGNNVYPNFFYEAPLIIQGNAESSAVRLEWMISELKRAGAAEKERERLEEQLRHAQKMESLGTLAAGIAHDFNNILNIIKGCASLIGRRLSADEMVAESLKAIDETIERGTSLVRQLLTLALKSEAQLASIDANDLISELSKLLRQMFPKTIDVSLELDSKLPPITADPNQINQALLNLCVNARDAMRAGGSLTLRTEVVDGRKLQDATGKTKQHVCVEVTDTGVGMDASVQSRIFEPFFTTKGTGEGTGLGLAIVYGVVKNHNGFIDVKSESGRGTTFRLYLPMALSEENSGPVR